MLLLLLLPLLASCAMQAVSAARPLQAHNTHSGDSSAPSTDTTRVEPCQQYPGRVNDRQLLQQQGYVMGAAT